MASSAQVAIITGSAQGIGRATALKLAERGTNIIIADIQGDKAAATADEVRALGVEAHGIAVDVTQHEQVQALVAQAMTYFSRIDILFNNAGNQRVGPTVDMSADNWLAVLGVHLNGAFFCCREVGKIMIEQRRGVIVNMASAAAFISLAERLPYCTAKAGLIGFTQSLAAEWAGYGIRVNAVAPGYIKTELVQGLINAGTLNETTLANTNALGRMGIPEEIASAVAFLCSDEASYITAHTLVVDGAFSHYKRELTPKK
jgi:NAD(P)-dependent dehydrogenase (short-subunit alcohol dehydrogenase family)